MPTSLANPGTSANQNPGLGAWWAPGAPSGSKQSPLASALSQFQQAPANGLTQQPTNALTGGNQNQPSQGSVGNTGAWTAAFGSPAGAQAPPTGVTPTSNPENFVQNGLYGYSTYVPTGQTLNIGGQNSFPFYSGFYNNPSQASAVNAGFQQTQQLQQQNAQRGLAQQAQGNAFAELARTNPNAAWATFGRPGAG